MHKIKQGTILLSISLLAGSNQLYAAETDHEHEQHAAHVHGEAQLLIAQEGDILEIAFLSPAMNIVGFEHQPKNETQTHAIEAAIETLKQPDLLFRLPSDAKCNPVTIEVESPLSKHDGHKHEHAHEDKHEHAHEEETHSDFTSHYHYQCGDISRLGQIEIELFKRFPGTEVIEVQSISNKGQQKIDLTPGESSLEL
jgi:ABC-type nickel/cobalt efflux system permease component RcnA